MQDVFFALLNLVVFIIVLLSMETHQDETSQHQENIIKVDDNNMEDFKDGDIGIINNTDISINNISTPPIEEDILWIYKSNFADKREKLVFALDRMSKYKDTTDFLEKYPFIYQYIFFANN